MGAEQMRHQKDVLCEDQEKWVYDGQSKREVTRIRSEAVQELDMQDAPAKTIHMEFSS